MRSSAVSTRHDIAPVTDVRLRFLACAERPGASMLLWSGAARLPPAQAHASPFRAGTLGIVCTQTRVTVLRFTSYGDICALLGSLQLAPSEQQRASTALAQHRYNEQVSEQQAAVLQKYTRSEASDFLHVYLQHSACCSILLQHAVPFSILVSVVMIRVRKYTRVLGRNCKQAPNYQHTFGCHTAPSISPASPVCTGLCRACACGPLVQQPQRACGCLTNAMAEDERLSRPLHRIIAAGKASVCRPAASVWRFARRRPSSAAFASIASDNDSISRGGGRINYSIFAPEETSEGPSERPRSSKKGSKNKKAISRFSSHVQQESEPLYTVTFPAWMVELYNDISTFGRAARRLFLPENSIKSKLPYYRCVLRSLAIYEIQILTV